MKVLIILIVLFIILYIFSFVNKKELFTQSNNWSNKTKNNFILFQEKVNPGIVFDLNIIQEQSEEQEAILLINSGMWPWSNNTQQLYMDSVSRNPYIRTSPEDSMNNARQIYNETAILQIIKLQSKEGQFLLHGIKQPSDIKYDNNTFGINSGLISSSNNIIRCNINPYTNELQLQKSEYIGNDGLFNVRQYINTFIKQSDITTNIPGFRFIETECNPCIDSCKFELTI